ncbi:MAG: hypothetical protein NT002_14010 [candidate division Zixibacteria bacterium]|nr:hypothetical protein [candidate division Zixibacteria bacterium]
MEKLNSRPEKIVNLFSAILVLVAGIYLIFFMPNTLLSSTARIIFGVVLIIYFVLRIILFLRRSRVSDEGGS